MEPGGSSSGGDVGSGNDHSDDGQMAVAAVVDSSADDAGSIDDADLQRCSMQDRRCCSGLGHACFHGTADAHRR